MKTKKKVPMILDPEISRDELLFELASMHDDQEVFAWFFCFLCLQAEQKDFVVPLSRFKALSIRPGCREGMFETLAEDALNLKLLTKKDGAVFYEPLRVAMVKRRNSQESWGRNGEKNKKNLLPFRPKQLMSENE